MRKIALSLLLLLPLVGLAGNRYKVITYMSADASRPDGSSVTEVVWAGTNTYSHFPLDSVSLSAIDILILFCNQAENVKSSSPYLSVLGGQPDSNLYFNGENGNYKGSTDTIIKRMHRLGKKVLLSLTSQSGSGISAIIADSSISEIFATNVAKLCKRHGFDGADLNVEVNVNQANMGRYLRIQRRRFNDEFGAAEPGRAIFTIVPGPGNMSSYPVSADSCLTYIMPQYYGWKTAWDGCIGRGAAWPGNAYSRGGWPACFEGANFLQNGPQVLVAQGWTASKIVPGIFACAYTFPGIDTIGGGPLSSNYVAETAVWYTRNYQYTLGLKTRTNSYTKQYELYGTQNATTPYAGWGGPGVSAGGKVYITLPNDTTAKYISKYVDSLGLGGIMTWVLDKEIDRTKPINNGRIYTTERSQYWLSLYGDSGVVFPPVGTFSALPATLPYGGGNVTLQWTSVNATSAFISPGVGPVALSGSTVYPITLSTTFTLTLTGPGGSVQYTGDVTVSPPIPAEERRALMIRRP